MSIVLAIVLIIIIGYLLGSLPSAYLIGKLAKRIDIRDVGSKNMGAMNSMYNLGFGWGLLVLLLDAAKGALAVWIGFLLGDLTDWSMPYMVGYIGGFMAIIGHNFPVWLKFKGGKGGATVVGICCFLYPWGIIFALAIFGLLTLFTKWPTISYGIALLVFFIVSLLDDIPTHTSIALLVFALIPWLFYIPRLVQVWKGYDGDIKRILKRKNLQDRK